MIGFSLAWEAQEHGAFWMTGDTVLHDGVKQVPDRIRVGTVLLHLGRVRFTVTGPVHYSLTAREGVELLSLVRPETAIPVHYEGWKHFTEGRADVERELTGAPPEIRDCVRWAPLETAVEIVA